MPCHAMSERTLDDVDIKADGKRPAPGLAMADAAPEAAAPAALPAEAAAPETAEAAPEATLAEAATALPAATTPTMTTATATPTPTTTTSSTTTTAPATTPAVAPPVPPPAAANTNFAKQTTTESSQVQQAQPPAPQATGAPAQDVEEQGDNTRPKPGLHWLRVKLGRVADALAKKEDLSEVPESTETANGSADHEQQTREDAITAVLQLLEKRGFATIETWETVLSAFKELADEPVGPIGANLVRFLKESPEEATRLAKSDEAEEEKEKEKEKEKEEATLVGKKRDHAGDDLPTSNASSAPGVTSSEQENKEQSDLKRRKQAEEFAKSAPTAPKDGLEFRIITNDGTEENLVWLINVKEIFAKQLPKMPKEYIVRLVMDRKHYSLVCIDKGVVVGGICFRPYLEQRFAEIAFLAVSAARQVKGVGTKLMNNLKQWVKSIQVTHFLTYADNFAIGYFRKQGFTKTITMPRERWRGYIKDYDGGTLMECSINEYVDYLRIPEMIAAQRKFLFAKIKEKIDSDHVFPGLNFKDGTVVTHLQDQVRGVREAGWAMPVRFLSRQVHHSKDGSGDPVDYPEYYQMQSRLYTVMRLVKAHREAWPFQEPVGDVVADYIDVIRDPIDISLIKKRLDHGRHYSAPEPLRDDMLRMCDNCCAYNGPDTSYYRSAANLRTYILNLFSEHFELAPESAPSFLPKEAAEHEQVLPPDSLSGPVTTTST
ncbi:Histone acetyltransferase GCN5 [Hondaea fermentalgiana]|uniref:Histone acetyltransferase GCN5 n=1 Tax=Hondaea fermentalgiana TaxID=2315210 RepID=A0A2R5H013_9STRA|nr:Histone acetyltransferase GCN5 [Hondaea fermentalgiana]|eukprot:GBG34383.1 Histone acetyltransferase GCN5 [Hondaea fermentalgiana]